MPSHESESASEDLRAQLQSIPEVSRAFLDTDPLSVHLVCRTAEGPAPDIAARAILVRAGYDAADVPIEISYLSAPGPARRARFVGSNVGATQTGHARARVVLEWGGESYEGEAEWEGGLAGEVRAAAHATTAALEAMIGTAVRLRLVGIKTIQAFDAVFVVALLRATDAPERPLVGVSIVSSTQHRSAALAVLNATNALFGNYVATI